MTDECAAHDHLDCSKVIADIAVFLDRELDDDELAQQMREHLADCPPCKDQADLEQCVRDLLRSRCAEQAPPDLVQRLRQRVGEWSGQGANG